MIRIRKHFDRGHFDHGWLNTWHTFSFADYHDPDQMGFSALRVINDDRIAPGVGFPTHGHRDMEILTYVMQGSLAHKDSMGNGSLIQSGDVQYMSAGKGVTHSEFNASAQEMVHLLQIWILPSENRLPPQYQQSHFSAEAKRGRWCLIASPDGADDSLAIRQDARLYAALIGPGDTLDHALNGRRVWLHIARGEVEVNDIALEAGDAVGIEGESSIRVVSGHQGEVLLFDLP